MIDEDTLKVGDILFDLRVNRYVLVAYVKKDRVDVYTIGKILPDNEEEPILNMNIFSWALQSGMFRHISDEEKAFVLLKLEFHEIEFHGIEIPR